MEKAPGFGHGIVEGHADTAAQRIGHELFVRVCRCGQVAANKERRSELDSVDRRK
jgi:hypothetical protein